MEIRLLPPTEYDRLLPLWQEAFGDGEPTVRAVLSAIADADCFVLEENGAVVSMLFSVPQTVGTHPIAYIYAVATAKTHRRQGLAARLLAYAEDVAQHAGRHACLLCPADENLSQYYEKLGYAPWSSAKAPAAAAPTGTAISPAEYLSLRENALADVPHNTPNAEILTLYTVRDAGVWEGKRQIDCPTNPHSALSLCKAFTPNFPKSGIFTFPMD